MTEYFERNSHISRRLPLIYISCNCVRYPVTETLATLRYTYGHFMHVLMFLVKCDIGNGRSSLLSEYVLTYLLTPWSRVPLEKLTGLQLVKQFPSFYGTRRFITAFTSSRHLSILSQLSPVHTPTTYFLMIRLNIILPSTPGSVLFRKKLRSD
jgi:hypothetical protein